MHSRTRRAQPSGTHAQYEHAHAHTQPHVNMPFDTDCAFVIFGKCSCMHAPPTPPHRRSPMTSAARQAGSTPYSIAYNAHAQTHAHMDANADMLLGRSMRRVLAFRTTAREIMSTARCLIHNMRDGSAGSPVARTHSTRARAHTHTTHVNILSDPSPDALVLFSNSSRAGTCPPPAPPPPPHMSIDGGAGRQAGQAR